MSGFFHSIYTILQFVLIKFFIYSLGEFSLTSFIYSLDEFDLTSFIYSLDEFSLTSLQYFTVIDFKTNI